MTLCLDSWDWEKQNEVPVRSINHILDVEIVTIIPYFNSANNIAIILWVSRDQVCFKGIIRCMSKNRGGDSQQNSYNNQATQSPHFLDSFLKDDSKIASFLEKAFAGSKYVISGHKQSHAANFVGYLDIIGTKIGKDENNGSQITATPLIEWPERSTWSFLAYMLTDL